MSTPSAAETDLFEDKARDWDANPIPAQISEGVYGALQQEVAFSPALRVLDFGAGTGLICRRLAPHVKSVLAVDVSPSMLEELAKKADPEGKIEVLCHDLLESPIDREVDLVVSAMAMHHVQDTRALLSALFTHLAPGGGVALVDLDAEDGDFHPPGMEGVFHAGFEREAFAALLLEAGFADPRFVTACEVEKNGKSYPIFLATANKPG